MKRKIVFRKIYVREIRAFELYLNRMAKKGWFLETMKCGLIFKKDKPQNFTYHVATNLGSSIIDPDIITEESKNQRKFFEDFGYQYVCEKGLLQVYVCNSNKPLYNDEYVDNVVLKKIIFKEMINYTIIPMVFQLLIMFLIFLRPEQQLNVLKSNNFIYIYIILLLTFLWESIQLFSSIKMLMKKDLSLNTLSVKFMEKSYSGIILIIIITGLALLSFSMLVFVLSLFLIIIVGNKIIDILVKKDMVSRMAMNLVLAFVIIIGMIPLAINVVDDHSSSIFVDYELIDNNEEMTEIYEIKIGDRYIKNMILKSNGVTKKETTDDMEIYNGKYDNIIVIKDNKVVVSSAEKALELIK